MEGKRQKKNNTALINVEDELLVSNVAELRAAILEALSSNDRISVDFGRTRYIDTAGMQLILAAIRTAGGRLSFLGNLQTITSAALRLGLDPAEFSSAVRGGK